MKEHDYIENIIIENLNDLNEVEPPEGHFERFEARLNSGLKSKSTQWTIIWKAAAVLLFAFLAVNQVWIWVSPREQAVHTLAGVSPEYAEVELYYTNAIQAGMGSWNKMVDSGMVSKEENEMMQKEFEDFDIRFSSLQKEFNANPNDERVINAMLEYYQVKLNIITMIVNKLQEYKQQNNKSHGTEI